MKPSPEYQVVWMPKATIDEVSLAKQSHLVALGIARIGGRYGVRVLRKDMQSLYTSLRPGETCVSGSKQSYEIGPLPFGTQREAIQKTLKEWGWVVKAIHPGAASVDRAGVTWRVVANTEPPGMIVPMSQGDVVIARASKTADEHVPKLSSVNASHRAMKCLQSAQSEDPWLHNDPWAKAKPPNSQAKSVPPPQQVPNQDLMKHIEEQVERAIKARAEEDCPMEGAETVDPKAHIRISQLEEKMQHLHQQQSQHLESQFRKLEGQTHALEQKTEATARTLKTMFDTQMTRIEALLQKTARGRSRSGKRE